MWAVRLVFPMVLALFLMLLFSCYFFLGFGNWFFVNKKAQV